jgi:hypothetical protein
MYVSKFKGIPVTSSIVNSVWTKGEGSAGKEFATANKGSGSKADYVNSFSGSATKNNIVSSADKNKDK